MKLSMLKRMSQIAVDDTESGCPEAAPEFREFLLGNFDEVAEALGLRTDAARASVRRAIEGYPVEQLPASVLAQCHSPGVRRASFALRDEKRDQAAGAVADELASSAVVREYHVELDAAKLVDLARMRPASKAFLETSPDAGLLVPLEPIRELAKVRKPSTWTVRVDFEGVTICWSKTGRWRSPRYAQTPANDREVRDYAVTVPLARKAG